jgi:hypothetical protein
LKSRRGYLPTLKSYETIYFSYLQAEEEILIRNAAVKELKDFDIGLAEKLLGVMEKQTVQASDPDLPEEMLVTRVLFGGKSLPKSRSNVSNYKKKRGRKK